MSQSEEAQRGHQLVDGRHFVLNTKLGIFRFGPSFRFKTLKSYDLYKFYVETICINFQISSPSFLKPTFLIQFRERFFFSFPIHGESIFLIWFLRFRPIHLLRRFILPYAFSSSAICLHDEAPVCCTVRGGATFSINATAPTSGHRSRCLLFPAVPAGAAVIPKGCADNHTRSSGKCEGSHC